MSDLKKETLIATVARAIEKDPISIEDILEDFNRQVVREAVLAESARCAKIAREFEYRKSGLGHLIDKNPNYPMAEGVGTAIATEIKKGAGKNE